MRKGMIHLLALLLSFTVISNAFAGDRKPGLKIEVSAKPAPVIDHHKSARMHTVIRHSGTATSAIGPGTVLMDSSWYDFGSNGGVLDNIVVYDDGTIAVGRMAAQEVDVSDRGTFFTFFDGTAWSAIQKVEQENRSWSSIAALADGRNVTVSHVANEVNIDALKGMGVWTSSITGYGTVDRAIWPRITIDGGDNIIICSTIDGISSGVLRSKEISISRDQGQTWEFQQLIPDTSSGAPASLGVDNQSLDSWQNKAAFAVAVFGGDVHLWESEDNGRTWTYRNLTNYPDTIAVGVEEIRPWDTVDLFYDNDGDIHILWEAVLALRDSDGPGIELFHHRDVGIQHWSEATGLSQVVSYSDIPAADQETDDDLFFAGDPFGQTDADNTLTAQPQGIVDANGNIYVVFCAYRPSDVDADGAHFTDIYVAGSKDNGANWGPVTNITDTEQSEDLWASVYDEVVDGHLHLVYQSDGNTGNSIFGGGEGPTSYLYHAFDVSNIDLDPTAVADQPDTEIPASFALNQNYPNPFSPRGRGTFGNPTTSLSFDLPKTAHVRLSIYAIDGKLVETLVDGVKAAGSHTVTWKAAKNLASGIYISRLVSEDFSQVKKMTLVK